MLFSMNHNLSRVRCVFLSVSTRERECSPLAARRICLAVYPLETVDKSRRVFYGDGRARVSIVSCSQHTARCANGYSSVAVVVVVFWRVCLYQYFSHKLVHIFCGTLPSSPTPARCLCHAHEPPASRNAFPSECLHAICTLARPRMVPYV